MVFECYECTFVSCSVHSRQFLILSQCLCFVYGWLSFMMAWVEKEVGFPAHSAKKLLGLFDESL